MNKKRILLLIVLVMFCSGWTGKYTLNYDYNLFTEKVEFDFEDSIYNVVKEYDGIEDGEFFEVDLLNNNIYATPNKQYKKSITNNNTTIVLTAEYSPEEFHKAEHLFECFHDHNYLITDKYYYLNLKGSFNCDRYVIDTFNLKVNGFNKVTSNASKIEDKIHSWTIKEYDNNIEIYIRRESYIMMSLPYILIIIGVITGIGLIIYAKSRAVNRI